MSTLVKKDLVIRRGHPPAFSLSQEGVCADPPTLSVCQIAHIPSRKAYRNPNHALSVCLMAHMATSIGCMPSRKVYVFPSLLVCLPICLADVNDPLTPSLCRVARRPGLLGCSLDFGCTADKLKTCPDSSLLSGLELAERMIAAEDPSFVPRFTTLTRREEGGAESHQKYACIGLCYPHKVEILPLVWCRLFKTLGSCTWFSTNTPICPPPKPSSLLVSPFQDSLCLGTSMWYSTNTPISPSPCT